MTILGSQHALESETLSLFVCVARRLAKAIRILPRIRSTRAVALGIDFDQRIQVDRVLLPEKMLFSACHFTIEFMLTSHGRLRHVGS